MSKIFKGLFKRSDDSTWKTLLDLVRNVGRSASGVDVSESSSITLSAVWAALVLISETMSTVPLQVFKRTNEGRDLYRDHPLYTVLHDKANRYETAQKFRERFFWNMEIAGIGLAEVIHTRGGKVAELYNLDPREVTEYFLDQNNNLNVRISGVTLGPDKLFYCYGPGQDGLRPRGRIAVARESIGLGLAAQEFGGRFFSQGTHNGGFIQTDKTLTEGAFERLKNSINEKYSGLDKAHKLIVLEEGLKFIAAGMSNEDAQFLETRKFQIADIARFFGVKSYMLGDLERATFSNIEQQGIENIAYSWRPRAVRFEQSVSQQLLLPPERKAGIYVEHNLNALKQGDLKSQVDAWHLLIQDGVMNSDEVRAMLNMNNQSDGQGEIYFMPANMQDKSTVNIPDDPADHKAQTDPAGGATVDDTGAGVTLNGAQVQAATAIVQSVAAGALPRDAGLSQLEVLFNLTSEQALSLMGSAGDGFTAGGDSARSGQTKKIECPGVSYHLRAMQSMKISTRHFEYITEIRAKNETSGQAIENLLAESRDFSSSLESIFETEYPGFRVDGYREQSEKIIGAQRIRAEKGEIDAAEEITRMRNAFNYAAIQNSDCTKVVWRSNPSCPHCKDLNGKVVEVGQSFITEGKIRHAPHKSLCDCDVEGLA